MTIVRFTDRWLQSASLAPNAGRAEYVDGLCPGLRMRVTSQGTRTFSAAFRLRGHLTRRTIGRYPLVTLAGARAAALEMMRGAQEGVDLRPRQVTVAAPAEDALTYSALVDAYVERHLRPNARSWRNIASGLRHARTDVLKRRALSDIKRRDIIAVVDSVVEEGKMQQAINVLRYLKMLFNWAAARDMITANPCDGVRPPARTTERDRVLSDQEILAVWRAAAELPAPYGAMYRMFLLTGQRRSEVATIRWRDVGLDGSGAAGPLWIIPRERVKKDRPHAVPLSPTAVAALRSLPCYGSDAYMFTTDGGARPSSNFAKIKAMLDRLSGTIGVGSPAGSVTAALILSIEFFDAPGLLHSGAVVLVGNAQAHVVSVKQQHHVVRGGVAGVDPLQERPAVRRSAYAVRLANGVYDVRVWTPRWIQGGVEEI